MFEIPALHPAVRAWLLEGPLAAFVPVYVARLKQGRYASGTVRRCLGALAHFAHWMALCRLPPTKLDESRVDQFLHDHLPHCGCPERAMRHPREAHAALMPLLAILRRQGVIAELPTPAGPIADELRRFEAHMRDARGLASGTCVSRLRIVERLLIHKFGGGALAFEALQPEDIRRFVAGQMELVNTTSNAATVNAALRAYLRWRATCGDAVQPLLAVIASPARWTLASLPRALKPEEVDRVLGSFTRTLRSPKRGYAIVRLALDLGLRTAEINRLQLDDIDWKQGTVVLRRTKSRRQDLLPLPAITGKALEAYVRYERPAVGGNRALFVRHLAPHDEPIGVHAIRRVVRDAFRRAGIAHGRAHALRHTLACRLVSLGSPIKEVADVLRHRSLNTALIYAKLNHRALTEVALPWPREQAMSARTSLTARMEQYLTERRRLGFELKHMGQSLGRFARYVKARAHRGPLTIELMASWARQAKGGRGERATAARALRMLRPFTRWLQQFEPSTEVPDEAIFGPVPGRVTPHIFQDEEIAALLEAAGRIGPPLSVRGAVMQTLFGLIACTGLRISEALALRDADVDLKAGVLTVRRGKFGKSRLVPLHPSAVAALARYRSERARFVPTEPQRPFFIGTRGRRLGQPVGERQAHRVFDQQRRQLGWIARGGHGAARIHDLRHSFAVRRLLCWHEQGVDVHARMLALSTYMGHAKICHTYWYLTAAPELMQLVGRRFEQFVGLPDDTGEEHAHG